MRKDMQGLLNEYCASLADVRKALRKAQKEGNKGDASLLRAMENDLQWSIEYMVTGFPPVESTGPYKKTIPVDPQKVLVWFTQSHPAPLLPSEKARQQVLSALGILSSQEKEAFMMVVGEGLSYGEAAEMLGVSRSTAQSYVDRAKVKIKECRAIQQTHNGEGEKYSTREEVFSGANQEHSG